MNTIDRPLISVIMPAYNAQAYIEEAIASIQRQTEENFELIIVDDASTDATLQIVKRLQSRDPRIKLIANERNLKSACSLNKGLGLAKGDFIARMDADDIAHPNRFERQLSFLRAHQGIDMCGAKIQLIDSEGGLLQHCNVVLEHDRICKTLEYMVPIEHPTWFCRASFFKDLNGYREMAPVEDYDLLLRAIDNGKVLANIKSIELSLRISNSTSAASNSLAQRKAFNYVRTLHRQRMLLGRDKFNKEDFAHAMQSSESFQALHGFSQRMYMLAAKLKHRRNPLFAPVLLIAVFASIYQAQFVARNLMVRLASKR